MTKCYLITNFQIQKSRLKLLSVRFKPPPTVTPKSKNILKWGEYKIYK